MKRIIYLLIIVLLVTTKNASAQSGWQENSYYNERGASDIICGNCYSVLVGYNYYGQPIYQWYQNCQRRVWYSWYGGRNGYYWTCGGGNCYWDYHYEVRTWWYFTWTNFTRVCN